MEEPQTPQYYYDSAARQWWVFNMAKGEWELCPDSEQTGQAPEGYEEAIEEEQQQQQQDSSEAALPPADAAAGEEAAAAAVAADAASSAASQSATQAAASANRKAADAPAAGSKGEPDSSRPGGPASAKSSPPAGASAASARDSISSSSSSRSEGDNSSEASSHEADSADALGSALERLMTTNISRGLTHSLEGSASGSFAWRTRSGEGRSLSDSDSSSDEAEADAPPPEPIVRRVTRCMTRMDQGGLADCIQKAVELRQHIIDTEKGGHVPGAEDAESKEEAWKIKARERAQTANAEARERAKSRWRAAALELAAQQQQQRRTPDAKAQRFADIVGLVAAARKKSLAGPSASAAFCGCLLSVFFVCSPRGSPRRRATELPNLPVWDERPSQEVRGRIRFADATLRDPTHERQVSGLLGPNPRRHTAFAAENKALIAPTAPRR
ncbi:hypothetical protein Efla_000705 [Eimeria flavescens]